MTERMPQATDREVSSYAFDSAKCSRCNGVLLRHNFATDVYGQTVEDCPRCGPKLLGLKRGAPVSKIQRSTGRQRVVGKCVCGAELVYRGTGGIPSHCIPCQAIRKAVADSTRNKDWRRRQREAMQRKSA